MKSVVFYFISKEYVDFPASLKASKFILSIELQAVNRIAAKCSMSECTHIDKMYIPLQW